MLWNMDPHAPITEPELLHVCIIVRYSGEERIISENLAKEIYGDRWSDIWNGLDKLLVAYPHEVKQ